MIDTESQAIGPRGHFKRWRVAAIDPRGEVLAASMDVSALLGQLLCGRGVTDAEKAERFVEPKLTDLHDPGLLPGCDNAANRLVSAVRDGEPIVIYGDYDVDGVTAAAILFHTLKAADPRADVRRYVPHRLEEGYGLNTDAIVKLCEGGARVIVTVDCGITAAEPAVAARERGVDLIITDHHQRAETLPDAPARVHPGLDSEEPYPFPDLCGAGVAYKLAWQFARRWCGGDHVTDAFRQLLVDLLSLAALGTIADAVPLLDENRVIASFGLRRIKHTPFAGLNALIDSSDLRGEKIDAYHAGFVLGPRLNACGRMGHAKEAVKLLTDADPADARRLADFLNQENERRRAVERRILEQARAMVVEAGYDSDDHRVIVLAHDDWHAGVVGIVCSRLVDAFGRPTVLLSTANGLAHGSARSIDGFDIHAAFAACGEFLETYGGHAMAAGLQLLPENVDPFRDALLAYAAQRITPEQLTPVLDIASQATFADLDPAIREIQRLQPFGRANPSPVLLFRDVRVTQPATTMGRNNKHLRFHAEQAGVQLRCIAWGIGHLSDRFPAGATLHLAAEPRLNHFNGRTTTELTVLDFSPASL